MAFWDKWLSDSINKELDLLAKADPDALPEKRDTLPDDPKNEIGRQAIIDDPFFTQQSQQTLYKYRLSRLSNKTLKDVSLRDWLVSAIIQNRLDTIQRFSRPQIKKFDLGYRIVKRDENEEYSKQEKEEIQNLQAFIYHCGRLENTPDDDKILFGEFLKMITRDALTFGNVTIEKVRTRRGALHRFRPVPAESVYHVNKNASKEQIKAHFKSVNHILDPKSDNDPKGKQKINKPNVDFYKYVQVSFDNKPLAVFGDEDMIFRLFNPQNFQDSNGYCYSPLELAIHNITHHMNTETYNSNFFTHGQAAKGILHLKGTVTQSQLTQFRRQFYNVLNGSHNAWRTPIVAGLEDVQWVPMAGGSKDMEYLNYNMHLMRNICSQFQIDPLELGLDLLVTGGRAVNQMSSEAKIEQSRERGFYPILMFIEDIVNRDIIPAIDTELAKKYKFQFEGYTAETPQTEVALLQAEMTVHKSMNDLLKSQRKEKIDHVVADLPMNQAFWALVEKNMTRGEIREIFFKDKDASTKKELQYIPADPAFLNWQQMLLQLDQLKKQEQQMEEQMQAQAQAQEAQAQEMERQKAMQDAQHAREQEKHDAEMDQVRGKAAYNAKRHGSKTKETAKNTGNSGASNIGGTNVKNPLNLDL